MPVSPETAEIITRKKSQYGRCIDTKQWKSIDQVALPDAELTFLDIDGSDLKIGPTPLHFVSCKSFGEFCRKLFQNAQTLHMLGPGELDQTAADEVTAIWSMEDQLIMNFTAGLGDVRGGGYYFETWKLRDGDWFLKDPDIEEDVCEANCGGTGAHVPSAVSWPVGSVEPNSFKDLDLPMPISNLRSLVRKLRYRVLPLISTRTILYLKKLGEFGGWFPWNSIGGGQCTRRAVCLGGGSGR